MRVKSQWHGSKPRDAKQIASAVAFIAWRVAEASLKHMRTAKFDIDIGPHYFAFLSEFLIFLTHIADRIAYKRLDEAQRKEFTIALVTRAAEIMEENKNEWLGPSTDSSYKNQFISMFNARSDVYAQFTYNEGPDFSFICYLGNTIRDIMPDKDKSWVVDQVMSIEAPEAIDIIDRSMLDLLEPPEKRRVIPIRVSGD
ncbi:MAG: hypothetical protein ACREUA_00200 [Burkholderiales bacterium]